MQYKKYKNQAGMNLTLPPPSQNSHYYYYYAAFNAPCVGHKDDESQVRCARVPDYFGNLLLTLRFRFVFRLSWVSVAVFCQNSPQQEDKCGIRDATSSQSPCSTTSGDDVTVTCHTDTQQALADMRSRLPVDVGACAVHSQCARYRAAWLCDRPTELRVTENVPLFGENAAVIIRMCCVGPTWPAKRHSEKTK